jgi:integrase
MAEPYKEGNGWAFRLRKCDQDIYRSGFKTKAAASRIMAALSAELDASSKAFGFGPYQTTVGAAFADYARARLPFLKGARQDANRINRYLRHLGLPVIRLSEAVAVEDSVKAAMRGDADKTRFWVVEFVSEPERRIPKSLQSHRARLQQECRKSDVLRKQLAGTMMADVTTHQLGQLMTALQEDGYGAASVHLERAELRRLFSHARSVWQWSRPIGNPAHKLDMPTIDNKRSRILTNAEWQRLAAALGEYANPYALPLVCIMLESAMRSCEPLTRACWSNVDWDSHILRLDDSKTGKRDVPLSPDAMSVLHALKARVKGDAAAEQIFPTTYEAFKKAWSTACKQCGIENLKPHDLRHTAATRYALQFNGNMPMLKIITGHKTYEMLDRYVNLNAQQVACLMHQDRLTDELAPAGYQVSVLTAPGTETLRPDSTRELGNVVKVNFSRKCVA